MLCREAQDYKGMANRLAYSQFKQPAEKQQSKKPQTEHPYEFKGLGAAFLTCAKK